MVQKQPTIQEWIVENFGTSLDVESPMEALFAASMRIIHKMDDYESIFRFEQFRSQVVIGRYRLDFAICGEGSRGTYRIGVEIDGHEFHDRTKEQASSDRRKDRELTTTGWRIIRFTGSDVHRNGLGCAKELCELVYQAHTGLNAGDAARQFHMDRIAEMLRGA